MKYQVMPDLSHEDYAELKADIAARGVQVAVEYDEEGNILDGHHRVRACNELGITEWPRVERVGMTEEQKRSHARKLNMARRHLSREQRQELIRQQLTETPDRSDRQIAAGLGVSHVTVGNQREKMESIGQLDQCNRQTSDGRTYPAQRKPITLYNPTRAEIEIAKTIIETAAPELIEAVAAGKVPLMQAHSVASVATPEQQAESVKRLESGDIPYLMEGYNQQKLEAYLHQTPEQRKQMEERIRESDKRIDREYDLSAQIYKIIDAVYKLDANEINDAVRYLMEHERNIDRIDVVSNDISICIDRLQLIKAAFSKTARLKVVK